MDPKELLIERLKVSAESRALIDAHPKDWNAEHQASFDKMQARIAEIKGVLDRIAAVDAEDREMAESRGRKTLTTSAPAGVEDEAPPTAEEQDLAFRGWALGRRATEEMRAAAAKCGVDISRPEIAMGTRARVGRDGEIVRTYAPVKADRDGDIKGEYRALSIGTTTAGGNSIPNEMMREFYEVQKWYGNVRGISKSVQTESGATLPWPTVTDTSNTGRILAEATAATTTTDQTFGVVNLGAYKFSSDAVLVSWELLQDSFIDLSSYLGRALGTRIGRIQNTKFTVGAGTTEPKGIITACTTSAAAASASTSFTFDDLITLIHTLDPAYRSQPGVQFMLHDTIAAYIRKFKDGQGRYLWEMSTQLGVPDRLFGYPVTINNDMDSALTTGKKLVFFGLPGQAFLIRDAGAVRFVRSDEKYILEHQVVFEASQRSDSNALDATALRVLTLN